MAIPVGGEGLEQIDDAQISLAKKREGLGVFDVFQINPVDPLAENLQGLPLERKKRPVSMQQPILGLWSLIDVAIVSMSAYLCPGPWLWIPMGMPYSSTRRQRSRSQETAVSIGLLEVPSRCLSLPADI